MYIFTLNTEYFQLNILQNIKIFGHLLISFNIRFSCKTTSRMFFHFFFFFFTTPIAEQNNEINFETNSYGAA